MFNRPMDGLFRHVDRGSAEIGKSEGTHLSGPVLIIKTEAWRNALKRNKWTERQAPVARNPFTMCAKILGENLDLVTISEQGPNRGAKQALDGKKIGYQLLSIQSLFRDRKSTRLNSSHVSISYAVFCLKKKKRNNQTRRTR